MEETDMINMATQQNNITRIVLYIALISISYMTVAFYATTVAIIYTKSITIYQVSMRHLNQLWGSSVIKCKRFDWLSI